MDQPGQPYGLKGRKKGSKLDPFEPQLDQRMRQGIFNCVVLLEKLPEVDYDGSLTIFADLHHQSGEQYKGVVDRKGTSATHPVE